MSGLSRRQFLRRLAALGIGVAAGDLLAACAPQATPVPPATTAPTALPTAAATLLPTASPQPSAVPVSPTPTAAPAYLSIVRGTTPADITTRAIAALGGIERFVKPGANVIVKPNICIADYTWEYGATTHPEIVATLVRLCLGAGAKRVRVMDQPFSGTPDAAYVRSGIADAVKAAGGQMEIMADMKYRDAAIPNGKELKKWRVYGDILDADVVINVPIAKTHGYTRLTLGGKNLMGVIEDRGGFHASLGQRIADLTSLVKPALTLIDATRIMVKNGPTGGSLDDLKVLNTVIASADIVAADTYATGLFGLKPANVPYIPASAAMQLGTMDLGTIKVEEINV